MKKQIVNHDLVRVYNSPRGTEVHIKLQEGGWVEHYPFTPDLAGIVAAMALATDVIAGKIYLKSIIKTGENKEIENKKQITHKTIDVK